MVTVRRRTSDKKRYPNVFDEKDDFFDNFDDDSGSGSSSGSTSSYGAGPVVTGQAAKPAPTLTNQEMKFPMETPVKVTLILGILCGAIILVSTVLGIVVGNGFPWTAWQLIIGIGGGLSVTTLVGLAIYWLDDKGIADYQLPVVVLVTALTVANFVLCCRFAHTGGSDWFEPTVEKTVSVYKYIFICLGFISVGLSLFFTFHMYDFHWCVTMGIVAAFAIAFLVSGWIMPAWNVWQWIIGIMVSVLFLAPFFVMELKGEFMLYVVSMILSVLVMVINFLLVRNVGLEKYRTIFIWVSSAELVAALSSFGIRAKKGDMGWAKVEIAPFVAAVVLLLLGLLLK